jgi:hypothetical protein
MNSNPHATRAMGAATASLMAFGVCLYMLITTANAPDGPAVPLVVFLSLGIAVTVILHLAFVGIAAARSGRRPWLWVVLAMVGFPVTAAVGLVLMAYFDEERTALPAAR